MPEAQVQMNTAPKARFITSLEQPPQGFIQCKSGSAESAIHSETDPELIDSNPMIEARFQRLLRLTISILGRCPRLW
jgi:hypothetical protein